MSDEQIIYLDPDDELTKVRERLERISVRRVVLIVPQQTQLRSHVGWRLLHARAREIGKDVLVISADRQVRAVAKAAGFRVAESPDSSSASKGRMGSRPSRNGQDSRTVRQRAPQRNRSVEMRRREPLPPPAETVEEPRTQGSWEDTPRDSQVNESIPDREIGTNAPAVPLDDDELDRTFTFRIDSLPPSPLPRSPRGSTFEDDEQEQRLADYEITRRIWEAAELGKAQKTPTNPMQQEPASSALSEPDSRSRDPFDAMEDRSSVPLPEQRASTFVHAVGEDVPDIADMPTASQEMHEIEYLGDQGDFMGTQQIPERQWPDMFAHEPEEEPPPSRVYGTRQRGSRSGKLPRRPAPDLNDADSLAPIEDRPTMTNITPVQSAPVQPPRSTGGLSAARSGSLATPPPSARPRRNVTIPPSPPPPPRVTPRIGPTAAGRPLAPPQTSTRSAPRQSARRGGRILSVLLLAVLLLFLVGVGLFYFGTSATVTITVPAKTVTVSAIKLNASSTTQNKAQNTVASQILTFTASATGNGTATGTTKQGNSLAAGTVFINNKGTQQVDIPTGITVSTSAGAGSVVFATTADAVIAANSSIPIPVQAQTPGPQGNVRANTIIEITADGYTKIALANNVLTSSLNLSVTNPTATSGGGAANAPSVTANDLAALKLSLHQKIQAQVTSWLATQLHKNDQHGTLIPDVLGSKNPLAQENLTQTPAVGQALTSSAITGTLTVQVKVLVARAAGILMGAQQQLNAYALKQHPAAMLTSPDTVQITKIASSSPKDGLSLIITLNATGQSVPQVILSDLSKFLTGKTVDQAKADIKSGDAGIALVEDVQVIVTPSFLNLMPFRPEHIHISILPGPAPKGGLPNG